MKLADIKIGETYRVKIGCRLAPVRVNAKREKYSGGRWSWVFDCTTQETRRDITCTAARLRPLADAPRASKPAPVPVPFDGPEGDRWRPVAPVPGLLDRVDTSRPCRELSHANLSILFRIVDAEHVAEGMLRVARVVKTILSRRTIWATIPRAMRRAVIFHAAARHARNRETYRAVMGHAPLPSPRAIAEAVGIACGLGPEPVC